jgi:hypothetical protein
VLETQPYLEVSRNHSKFPHFYNIHIIIIIIVIIIVMFNLSTFTYS